MRKGLFLLYIAAFVILIIHCGESLTEKQIYEKAKLYEAEEKTELAVQFYEKLVDNYPQSELAPEALFKVAIIAAGQQQKLENAIEVYLRLVQKYPESEFAPKSQFMVGYLFANEVKDTTKAKEAYNIFLEKFAAVDSGMTASAKFELANLGKDISDIGFLKNLEEEKPAEKKAVK